MSEMELYICFRRLYPPQDMVRSLRSDLLAAGILVERAGGAWAPVGRTRRLRVRLADPSAASNFGAALVTWLNSRWSPVSLKIVYAGKTEAFNSLMPAWQVERLLHLVLPFAGPTQLPLDITAFADEKRMQTTIRSAAESAEIATDSDGRTKKADGTVFKSGDGSTNADRVPAAPTARSYSSAGLRPITVTIYLTNQAVSEQAEAAIDRWLATADLLIIHREEPVFGSWFRQITVVLRRPAVREAALVAAHAADTRLVLAQDAAVTATLLQNLGPVITSLQPTKDAVLRIQSLLIVKVEWVLQVYQLTAAQQAVLDHQPQLLRSPGDITRALNLIAVNEQTERTLRLNEKQPEPG